MGKLHSCYEIVLEPMTSISDKLLVPHWLVYELSALSIELLQSYHNVVAQDLSCRNSSSNRQSSHLALTKSDRPCSIEDRLTRTTIPRPNMRTAKKARRKSCRVAQVSPYDSLRTASHSR